MRTILEAARWHTKSMLRHDWTQTLKIFQFELKFALILCRLYEADPQSSFLSEHSFSLVLI